MCVPGTLFGQAQVAQQFEVASVKLSDADASSGSGIETGRGRIEAKNVTLKRCIMGAYGVGPHQISGGPDWLDRERFEILAKSGRAMDGDGELMQMLQSLLAERFKLTLHREKRAVSALVLEVAKRGAKLERAASGEAGTSTSTSNTRVSIDAHNTDMDSFARILSRKMDLPVVNSTGLAGTFNFKLQWSADGIGAVSDGTTEGTSIFSAIEDQLGLHLSSRKAPVEILVIDSVEKPSVN